jgi:hypothetical protein
MARRDVLIRGVSPLGGWVSGLRPKGLEGIFGVDRSNLPSPKKAMVDQMASGKKITAAVTSPEL